MKKLFLIIPLGMALSFTGFPAVLSADETEEESEYIEEIIVTSERGESNVLDRAMTVTGFNQVIIEKLGVQNADDLEVLVPGLQKGNRTQGGGKGEDGHYVMRGIGNDRSVNFYSDVFRGLLYRRCLYEPELCNG